MNRKSLQWMSRILIATGGAIALTVGAGVDPAQATEPICTEGEVVYNVPSAYSTVLEEGKTVTIDTGLVIPVGKNAYLSSYFSWGGYIDSFLSLNGPAQTWRVALGGGASGYTADPADGADNFLVKGNFNSTLAGTGGNLVIQHSSVQSPTGVSGANAIYPIGFCYTLTDAPTTTTTTSTTTTTTTSTTTVAPTTVPPTTVAPTTVAPTTLPPASVPPFIVPPPSTVAPATTTAPTTSVLAAASTAAPTTAPLVSVAGVTVVQTTVPAPPAAPAEVKAGELAYTGSGSNGLSLLVAALLIGFGSTLLLVGRRRN